MATINRDLPDAFPLVRRGYDPAAVHRHLEMLEIEHRAATLPEQEAKEKADALIRAAHGEAAQVLDSARRADIDAQDRLDAAEDAVRAAEQERERLIEEGAAGATEYLAAARDRAEAILAEARRVEEEVQSKRWADVGDRVARILAVADDEGVGLLEEARSAAEALRAESLSEADRTRIEADRYAEEARALAEEWASARIAAADADQAKASEVLIHARARAERIETEAEVKVAFIHEEGSRRTTEHVNQLLAAARYDLDQLETRATEARAYLQGLRDLASRTLAADDDRPASDLGPASAFILRPAPESADDVQDAGSDDSTEDPALTQRVSGAAAAAAASGRRSAGRTRDRRASGRSA